VRHVVGQGASSVHTLPHARGQGRGGDGNPRARGAAGLAFLVQLRWSTTLTAPGPKQPTSSTTHPAHVPAASQQQQASF